MLLVCLHYAHAASYYDPKMLTPTKLALLIHPLECSGLSWFYHDLYQELDIKYPL